MGWQMTPMNQQEIIFSPTSYIRVLWYRPPYTIWVFVIGLCLVMGQLTLMVVHTGYGQMVAVLTLT
jgi:hypothetical protein